MSIKKWSTGPLGNPYPSHDDRGNPNTRGLDPDGLPGIEGYIEEDEVIARDDNRPLVNLADNDNLIINNLSDVASEVDYGVFSNRYQEFDIEILEPSFERDPESGEEVHVNKLRVYAGSSIINGVVTRTGNQKLIYFYRDDGSQLFPNYTDESLSMEIFDDDYFGDYEPVYSTLSQDLPSNFDQYTIRITNRDSADPTNLDKTRISDIYHVYRDWEDIIPYQPYNESVVEEEIDFVTDLNFGQQSDGYWLNSGGTQGSRVSNVEVKKDIPVIDKELKNFTLNSETGKYEEEIITDGVFFEDIRWTENTAFDQDSEIQEVFIDSGNNLYFIQRSFESRDLFRIQAGSNQLESAITRGETEYTNSINIGIKNIGKYLFLHGTDGLLRVYELGQPFQLSFIRLIDGFHQETTEDINDVMIWDNKIWISGDTKLWYVDYDDFTEKLTAEETVEFKTIDLSTIITNDGGTPVIKRVKKLKRARGNYSVSSSLQESIFNMVENSSFERGGVGNVPTGWQYEDDDTDSTFEIQPLGKFGNRKAVITLGPASIYSRAYHDIHLSQLEEIVSNEYTFSVYARTQIISQTMTLMIEELDKDKEVLDSSQFTITDIESDAGQWGRYNVTHTIQNKSNLRYLRVSIQSNVINTNSLELDAVQLESGNSVSEYVDSFEHLVIAFRKTIDNQNPPLAFIALNKKFNDSTGDNYPVDYIRNVYGNIETVNDLVSLDNNNILFVSDNRVYEFTYLNNTGEFDRFTITERDIDLSHSIYKFETIQRFGDRIYFGGVVNNPSITVRFKEKGRNNRVSFLDYQDPGANLHSLLEGSISVNAQNNDEYSLTQLNKTSSLYEANVSSPGYYVPDTTYYIVLRINNNVYTLSIQAPSANQGPWTLLQIRNALQQSYLNVVPELERFVEFLPFINQNPNYEEFVSITSNFAITDGFYSIGKNKVNNYIRGNVHNIFVRPTNTQNFHIAIGNKIFRTYYDPNKIRDENSITGYSDIDWDLLDDFYTLRKYVNRINVGEYENGNDIQFHDDSNNKFYIDIPLTPGYELLKGSLRIKTNKNSEVGFVEGRDYFVDYDNNRFIRNSSTNLLQQPEFKGVLSEWNHYKDNDDTSVFHQLDNGIVTYVSGTDNRNVISQNVTPTIFDVGDTYTFSVYVKPLFDRELTIRITERNNSNKDNYTIPYSESTEKVETLVANEWKRIDVSHTIINGSNTILRVEIDNDIRSQLYIQRAQLEKNSFVTPFILGQGSSRINPEMHVWLDFTEFRNLNSSDYTLDIEGRKIVLEEEIDDTFSYFLDYKYEKIFNPYNFGNAIPSILLSRAQYQIDDYFLYENEGRIWAINQMFAMLSFDSENPLRVSYTYSYPRIDLLKIRNTPDRSGNYLYLVKGTPDSENPYRPNDLGLREDGVWSTHTHGITIDDYISRLENLNREDDPDSINNDTLYALGVTSIDYTQNDVFDRRVYINARDNTNFNISLLPETLAYFPFTKDFNSTNGISPLSELEESKIIPIIKNYTIVQNEEIGAWRDGYQLNLRSTPPSTFSIHVDPITGRDNDPNYTGLTTADPVRTIAHALTLLTVERRNIIITSISSIEEDIEINKPFDVGIYASQYCYWRGGLKNLTRLTVQGIWFQHTNLYQYNDLTINYCTFEGTSINNVVPELLNVNNSEFFHCSNPIVRVNDEIFPSPFLHPYQKHPLRDDGVEHPTHPTTATSDFESIHPGDSFYDPTLDASEQPVGSYNFYRCLIHRCSSYVVQYDPTPDWASSFLFDYCTIVENTNLFVSRKTDLTIMYKDSILYRNVESRLVGTEEYENKMFDSDSSLQLNRSYIDVIEDAESSDYNFGSGLILGREGSFTLPTYPSPDFVGGTGLDFDYHLRSIARGNTSDSPLLESSTIGKDLGVYDESREQTERDIPRRLRSYVALINEAIYYPVTINSEKITVTLEFRPIGVAASSGILFDTRSGDDEEDFIVLLYNNNEIDDHSLTITDPGSERPYKFRVIIKNKEKSYAIVSPINIVSDEHFQVWHKISFTINYERIYNMKPGFAEKDTQQNIITLYHNDAISVESFIKFNLDYHVDGSIIRDRSGRGTNKWNYNDICNFITIGADYDNNNKMPGYYTEFRIDNRFVDRKQFDLWNVKTVPFNDPYSYINQNPLTKSFNPNNIVDYWSLKTPYLVGARGNELHEDTSYLEEYENGEMSFFLGREHNNIISNSGFENIRNASIRSNPMDWDDPKTINEDWLINTRNSRIESDNNGLTLNLIGTYQSQLELDNAISNALSSYPDTYIRHRFSLDGRLEFYTIDIGLTNRDANETSKIKFTNNVSGKYFFVNGLDEIGEEKEYYVWYTINGSGTDPNISGKTGIVVDVVNGTDYQDITTQTKAVLNSFQDVGYTVFDARDYTDSSGSLSIENDELVIVVIAYGETVSIVDLNESVGDVVGEFSTIYRGASDKLGQPQSIVEMYGDFGSTYSDFGFNTQQNFDEKYYSNWFVRGAGESNLDDTMWISYDKRYNLNSTNSLIIQKETTSENIQLVAYQRKTLEAATYSFSTYVYVEDGNISNSNVRFMIGEEGDSNGQYENWDRITKFKGNFFRLEKTFTLLDGGDYFTGVALISPKTIVVDSVKLEKNTFASPYVESYLEEEGGIRIQESLINKEKGLIFFRFKPKFDYYNGYTGQLDYEGFKNSRYIVEALDKDFNTSAGYNRGFRIRYYFDPARNRGIFQFAISGNGDPSLDTPDPSVWEVEISERFWDQWHSVVFNYDFDRNQFTYWFDYMNTTIEISLDSVEELTDFFIGRGVEGLLIRDDETNGNKAAEICVKNLVVLDYPISDSEILSWINTYEFFNENLFYNILNKNIEDTKELIISTSTLSAQAIGISNQLSGLENDIVEIQAEQQTLFSNINSINNSISSTQANIVGLTNTVNTLDDIINRTDPAGLSLTQSYIKDGNTSNWTIVDAAPKSSGGLGANLLDLRTDIDGFDAAITAETNARIAGDLAIRNDLASNNTGEGASLVGIRDEGNKFIAQNVETALSELAGPGRTVESVRQNAIDIAELQSASSVSETDIEDMKDGNTDNWTNALAQTNSFNIYDNRIDINANLLHLNYIKNGTNGEANALTTLGVTAGTYYGSNDPNEPAIVNGINDLSSGYNWKQNHEAFTLTISGNDIVILLDENTSTIGQVVSHIANKLSEVGITTVFVIQNPDDMNTVRFMSSTTGSLSEVNISFTTSQTWTTNSAKVDYNLYDIRKELDTEVYDRQFAIQQLRTDLAATSGLSGTGASAVGIYDINSAYVGTTVEAALAEIAGLNRTSAMTVADNSRAIDDLAGEGRTIETVYQNSLDIQVALSGIETNSQITAQMADGDDGSTWTNTDWNLVNHESRLDGIDTEIGLMNISITQNATNIGLNTQGINSNSQALIVETNARIAGDNLIRSDLASNLSDKGASLVGIYDSADNFTSTNVEGALTQLHAEIAALAGSLSWKEPVDTPDDLPMEDNALGDARTVHDDGDGYPAQYIWDGSVWIKIADINWGEASSISYDPTESGLTSTNVKSAIDELANTSVDPSKIEGEILPTDWVDEGNGYHSFIITHEMGTKDVSFLAIDKTTGQMVEVEEVESINHDQVKIITANQIDIEYILFGVVNSYSQVINSWTSDGNGGFYQDINHNFNSMTVKASIFNTLTGEMIMPDQYEYIDANNVRVHVNTNTLTINAFILNKIESSLVKDLSSWTYNGQDYETTIVVENAYDAIYTFFDPSTSRTVYVDKVSISGGNLTIRKTNNDRLRMIILK